VAVGRTPKIADVAARAGVSLSTVSRVMNGNPSVDATLADRVRTAAAELGYSASPIARGLVLGRTQTVAVVVPDLGNPTFVEALRGLSTAAVRDGYHVLIADSSENLDEERLLAIEARRRCDAIVLLAPRMPEPALRELLATIAPVVVVNRALVDSPAPVVVADYRSGFLELLEYNYSMGHRHLAYLAGSAESESNSSRLAGITDFRLQHTDARVDVIQGGVSFESGYRSADEVLQTGVSAVLAFNDLLALGLLGALRERGVDVPGELSLCGFDDIPFSAYTAPPLTTSNVPVAELGEEAWLRLFELLGGGTVSGDLALRPTIVLRGSVAAPFA
jgi:LacI family transcriptional regulator